MRMPPGSPSFCATTPPWGVVNYPGLTGHPNHDLAARQMTGFGGMISFDVRDSPRVEAMPAAFRLIMQALSLGGVETLVCVPQAALPIAS
ncbi:MAG: PLP-dependent transferase [Limisphaerales bacterium]